MTKRVTTFASAGSSVWFGVLGAVGCVGVGSAAGCAVATAIRPQTTPAPAAALVVADFRLPSTLGGELVFAEVTQKSAVALVFYRGFW